MQNTANAIANVKRTGIAIDPSWNVDASTVPKSETAADAVPMAIFKNIPPSKPLSML